MCDTLMIRLSTPGSSLLDLWYYRWLLLVFCFRWLRSKSSTAGIQYVQWFVFLHEREALLGSVAGTEHVTLTLYYQNRSAGRSKALNAGRRGVCVLLFPNPPTVYLTYSSCFHPSRGVVSGWLTTTIQSRSLANSVRMFFLLA